MIYYLLGFHRSWKEERFHGWMQKFPTIGTCIMPAVISDAAFSYSEVKPEDMFVCDMEENELCSPPPAKNLKKSQCTPLFMNAYTMRGSE